MGRKKRMWHPEGYYHIVVRGNNRQNIFIDEIDIREYHRVLAYAYDRYPFDIHAYCIMSNHVHLLLRSKTVHLGILMRAINKRYSDYYRKRHQFTGQIYENRYYSKEVIAAEGLLKVSHYIHRNPLETKTPMVSNLEHYPYSSYPNYFYNEPSKYPYVRIDYMPTCLPKNYVKTPKAYAAYCSSTRYTNDSDN